MAANCGGNLAEICDPALQLENLDIALNVDTYTDMELVQKSSAGVSLCGVLLLGKYEDMVQSREQVLAIPQELTLTNPTVSQHSKYVTFVCKKSEQRFHKSMFSLGLSATKLKEDKLIQEQYADETFVCATKYTIVPKKAWLFKLSNMRLCHNLIWKLQDVENEVNEGSAKEHIQEILKQYGSHILKGPIQYGGIYKQSSTITHFPTNKEKEAKVYAEQDLKSVCILHDESDQKEQQNQLSESPKFTVHHDVLNNGGDTESLDLLSWMQGIEKNNTKWQVIDRGEECIPIWDIIRHQHKQQLFNNDKVCNLLITVYISMITGLDMLDLDTLKNLTTSFIETMDIHHYQQQLKLLYKLKKEIKSKDQDDKWWPDCLAKNCLSYFCRLIVMIEEKTYTSLEKLQREQMKMEMRNLIADYEQNIHENGCYDEWQKVLAFIKAPMEDVTSEIPLPTFDDFPDIAYNTISKIKNNLDRIGEIVPEFADNLKTIIESQREKRAYLEEMLFCSVLEQYGFSSVDFIFEGAIDHLVIYNMVEYTSEGIKQLNTAKESDERAEVRVLLWCMDLPEKCQEQSYTTNEFRSNLAKWKTYFSSDVRALLEDFLTNTKQTKEEFESILLGNNTGYVIESLIKNRNASKRISPEEGPPLDTKSTLFKYRERFGLPTESLLHMPDIVCVNNLLNKNAEDLCEKDAAMWYLSKLIKLDYVNLYAFYQTEKMKDNASISSDSDIWDCENTGVTSENKVDTIHQSDLLVAILLSCDMVVQQFIFSKLAMCKLALPIVIDCTEKKMFCLWALRQISQTWQATNRNTHEDISHEERMCVCPTYIVSFIRLGSHENKSKSNILNHILYNQKHDVFLDRYCDNYRNKRELADGMIELAWYHPTVNGPFDQTLTFLNLRGDGQQYSSQLEFILQASNSIVVLGTDKEMKSFDKRIGTVQGRKTVFLSESFDGCKKSDNKVVLGIRDDMEIRIATKLIKEINSLLGKTNQCNIVSLEQLKQTASNCNIHIDEDHPECKLTKQKAQELISMLKGKPVTEFKETFLPLHRKMLKTWCVLDKQSYKLHIERGKDEEQRRCEIEDEKRNVRVRQRKNQNNDFIKMFYEILIDFQPSLLVLFLNWVAYYLDLETKPEILQLNNTYRQFCVSDKDLDSIQKADDDLIDSSLGLEHIFREISQLYAAVCETECEQNTDHMSYLPAVVAHLFSAGHAIELMDGDVSHLPMQWINAVLKETSEILKNPKIFVVSVLGVQSSGKSTLLNTMLGLQFAVSPGRCTRGAFMQLIRIDKALHQEFGYEYMLVVDTEGLKSSEIAELSTSSEHDNRLTTFVIGIADVTIINIAGESVADMEGLLQIAVQAFIRMGKVNISPRAFFLHQNVGAVNAKDKNLKARRELKNRLNRMTCIAAKEESTSSEHSCFNDVITFNDESVDYISGFMKGDPPMAPPNPGYSTKVHTLQQRLMVIPGPKKRISDFIPRVNDLWSALLCENFVFNFRNAFEISVYTKIENIYTNSRAKLHITKLDLEKRKCNEIRNAKSLSISLLQKVNAEIENVMGDTHKTISTSLEKLCDEDKDKATLNKWKFSTQQQIRRLNESLQDEAKVHCKDCYNNKKALAIVETQKQKYENRIMKLAQKMAKQLKGSNVDENHLKKVFEEIIWRHVYNEVSSHSSKEKPVDIANDAISVLNEQYSRKTPELLKIISKSATSFKDKTNIPFNFIANQHINYSNKLKHLEQFIRSEMEVAVNQLVDTIRKTMNEYIKEKHFSTFDYRQSYFYEILQIMDAHLQDNDIFPEKYSQSNGITFKPRFEVDLTLHLFSIAAITFIKMHYQYIEKTSPRVYLERNKKGYFETFTKIFKGAASCNIAVDLFIEDFTNAVKIAVRESLGISIGDELSGKHVAFNRNRSNLDKYILMDLAKKQQFKGYKTYITSPKDSVAEYIEQEVIKWCMQKNDTGQCTIDKLIESEYRDLQKLVLRAITDTTRDKDNKDGIEQWTNSFLANITINEQFDVSKCIQRIKDLDIDASDIDLFATELTGKIQEIFKFLFERLEIERVDFLKDVKTHPSFIIKKSLTGCWKQCPFCGTVCTNTLEDHVGKCSTNFHRPQGLYGWRYTKSQELLVDFCTHKVGSDAQFYTDIECTKLFPYREYQKAGKPYSDWQITFDSSEKSYWKWVTCFFQKDVEIWRRKKYTTIPSPWYNTTQSKAIEELGLPK